MSVVQFYSGRSVLVTGFTGLIGKLVVEKLLWSCPDIDNIYILIRPKKGLTAEERLRKVTNLLAFDRVREKYPGAIESKLVAVNGDISLEGLGLSEEDKSVLCKDVSVIFHSAASVRFDDDLGTAVNMNMIATKRLLDLSLNMTKLVCFLHVSTAYSNCDHMFINEEMYPAHASWPDMINVTKKIDPSTLQIFSEKLMDEVPNTYIYTKALTEHIVNDYRDRIPVAIVRPSVVVPAYKEPVPGWIDNTFGPLGINVALITGMATCSWGDSQGFANYVHTDFVVNSIILAAYKQSLHSEDKETPVYNACSPPSYKCTHEEYMRLHKYNLTERYLHVEGINLFSSRMYKAKIFFKINFLVHMISALLLDLVLIIMKKPPMLTKIRRGIFIGNMRLRYFVTNSISFEVKNFLNLPNNLSESDTEHFGYDFKQCSMKEVYYNALVLSKKVLLKPLFKNISVVSKVLKWLRMLDVISVVMMCVGVIWLFTSLSFLLTFKHVIFAFTPFYMAAIYFCVSN